MRNIIKNRSVQELPLYIRISAGIFAFIFGIAIFLIFPIPSIDWRNTYYPVSQIPWHPYNIRTFVNLPWTALILYPLHCLPVNFSLAINASLNIIVVGLLVMKRKGNLLSLVLTFTSFPFLALLANGSIEWIPALGFIFQNGYGIIALLTKPQSGILAILSWFRSVKNKWLFFLPAILTIAISFLIWKNWLNSLVANLQFMTVNKLGLFTVSVSPFPWGIPLGLGLIYYILKYKPNNSEFLGTLSTFFLAPYFVPHSLTILFALLSSSNRRIAIIAWILLWLYPILTNWATFIRILGFY